MLDWKRGILSWLLKVAIVSLAYFLAGRLALLLAIPPGYATATWPAAGVALVALLVWGNRILPGILVGSFLTNIWTTLASGGSATGAAVLIATSIGMGAALQGLLGAWLIHRFIGYPNPLVREGDIVKFLGLGGPVSCLVGATWGVATLCLTGLVPQGETTLNWMTWWVGDTIGVLTCAPLLLVLVGQPREIWKSRTVSVALPTVVAFALVVVIYVGASRWEQNSIEADFRQRCSEQAGAIRTSFTESMNALNLLASLFKSSQEVTSEEFSVFCRHVLADHIDMLGLSWNPRVTGAQRDSIEQRMRASGFPEFRITERSATGKMIRAGEREEYTPVMFAEPYVGYEHIHGYDVGSEPVRRAALQVARDTASATATGPIVLLSKSKNPIGVLVFHPIYSPEAAIDTVEQRRANLRGYATVALRIRGRIDGALAHFDRSGIDIALWDDDAPVADGLIYASGEPEASNPPSRGARILPTWSDSFEFAG